LCIGYVWKTSSHDRVVALILWEAYDCILSCFKSEAARAEVLRAHCQNNTYLAPAYHLEQSSKRSIFLD